MKRKDWLELQREVQEEYPDLEFSRTIPIQFPCWKYEANILYSPTPTPETLDKTFIELIKSGIDTRAELAEVLGIEENEFIFKHLCALVNSGFVEYIGEGVYRLTERGNYFDNNCYSDEKIQNWPRYGFIRDCASGRLSRSFQHLDQNSQNSSSAELLKHLPRPSEADVKRNLSGLF